MSENPEWMETAPCRGMDQDIFYPQRGEDVSVAKAVCAQCPHRQPCLDYAIAHGEHHGIWGGMSERQRREYRRKHGRICNCCGGVFRPVTGGQRYCSDACSTEARRVQQQAWQAENGVRAG